MRIIIIICTCFIIFVNVVYRIQYFTCHRKICFRIRSSKHFPIYFTTRNWATDCKFFYDSYMRINVIALLVDLFNVFEIHPASCVVSENANGMVTSNPESNFAPAQFEPGN